MPQTAARASRPMCCKVLRAACSVTRRNTLPSSRHLHETPRRQNFPTSSALCRDLETREACHVEIVHFVGGRCGYSNSGGGRRGRGPSRSDRRARPKRRGCRGRWPERRRGRSRTRLRARRDQRHLRQRRRGARSQWRSRRARFTDNRERGRLCNAKQRPSGAGRRWRRAHEHWLDYAQRRRNRQRLAFNERHRGRRLNLPRHDDLRSGHRPYPHYDLHRRLGRSRGLPALSGQSGPGISLPGPHFLQWRWT